MCRQVSLIHKHSQSYTHTQAHTHSHSQLGRVCRPRCTYPQANTSELPAGFGCECVSVCSQTHRNLCISDIKKKLFKCKKRNTLAGRWHGCLDSPSCRIRRGRRCEKKTQAKENFCQLKSRKKETNRKYTLSQPNERKVSALGIVSSSTTELGIWLLLLLLRPRFHAPKDMQSSYGFP